MLRHVGMKWLMATVTFTNVDWASWTDSVTIISNFSVLLQSLFYPPDTPNDVSRSFLRSDLIQNDKVLLNMKNHFTFQYMNFTLRTANNPWSAKVLCDRLLT